MFDRDDCPEHGHRDDWGFDILQFTTHILGARPVDQLRYRNRTRLKYLFEAINIAKDLARLLDNTGGTTAVLVCVSDPIRVAVRHIIHQRASGHLRLIDLDLEPSCPWWTNDDPFDPTSAETGTGSGPVWTPASSSNTRSTPSQTRRLLGETLVNERRSWQGDQLAGGGPRSNHQRWVRQKIIEGGF
ncbi:uncharacterized protein N7484_005310 [Penicillium longicatenatum]|uniref:uncharacterized protein n=1 Tax=Penicillium longicatenatum TaxID=1561947 RepID=UPI0025490493|nr:uncharacterized protein N7484_005310 [Penicillium longicatenatum]KAJ5651587.1 hypothetical protein N7484_005310 [Penicillium longicatenatum]